MFLSLLVYLCCGAVAGVLAGLLGVGGGIVIVPMLVAIFPGQGVPPEYVQQMALGTSLASIMITSISSARAHNARGAVHWDIFRNITPGILVGTFVGGLVATHMPTMFLKIFFICFLFVVSAQMLSNYRPPASRDMPGALGTAGVGGVIGLVSSFVGIGGGTLLMVWMTGVAALPQQTAQGINLLYFLPSAACALFFHIRNRLIRWDIVLPAALGGCVTAAIAAWIATGLDVSLLRRLFGGFLLLTGLRELFFRQQRDKNAR